MKVVRMIKEGNDVRCQDFTDFPEFILHAGDMCIFHDRDGQLFLTYVGGVTFHTEEFQGDDVYWADGVLIKATPEEEFAYKMEHKV